MKHSNGFTLIELLLYLLAGVVVVSNTLFFASYIQTLTQRQLKPLHHSLEWYGALEAMKNDINAITDWSDAQTDNVWHCENTSICWKVKDGRLLRYKGNYNSSKKEWSFKRPAVVASDVLNCKFHYNHHNKKVTGVLITLTGKQQQGLITLVSRVIV